jgi:hypothetical protein
MDKYDRSLEVHAAYVNAHSGQQSIRFQQASICCAVSKFSAARAKLSYIVDIDVIEKASSGAIMKT